MLGCQTLSPQHRHRDLHQTWTHRKRWFSSPYGPCCWHAFFIVAYRRSGVRLLNEVPWTSDETATIYQPREWQQSRRARSLMLQVFSVFKCVRTLIFFWLQLGRTSVCHRKMILHWLFDDKHQVKQRVKLAPWGNQSSFGKFHHDRSLFSRALGSFFGKSSPMAARFSLVNWYNLPRKLYDDCDDEIASLFLLKASSLVSEKSPELLWESISLVDTQPVGNHLNGWVGWVMGHQDLKTIQNLRQSRWFMMFPNRQLRHIGHGLGALRQEQREFYTLAVNEAEVFRSLHRGVCWSPQRILVEFLWRNSHRWILRAKLYPYPHVYMGWYGLIWVINDYHDLNSAVFFFFFAAAPAVAAMAAGDLWNQNRLAALLLLGGGNIMT